MVGVTRIYRVMNEEVRRRGGKERELTGSVNHRVLKWFLQVRELMKTKYKSSESAGQTEGRLGG